MRHQFFRVLLSIFAMFTFAVSCTGISTTPAQAGMVDRIEAIVNNQAILMSDLNKLRRTLPLRREIDPFFNLLGSFENDRADNQTLVDYLIQERLVGNLFKVSDAEVEQKINEVIRTNNLSRSQLDQFLSSRGFTYSDYFDVMRVGLQKQALLDNEIRTRVNVSDDDVRNHYFNNVLKDSKAPMEYKLQMIAIHAKNFKSPKFAGDTANEALKSIKQGESFAEVAKRYSDQSAGPADGDLGFVPAEHINATLLQSIKKLQIGDVSPVVQAGDVYYIVRLSDLRTQENQRLDAEKERIRELLARGEYKRQLELWTERTKSSAFVKINSR